MVNSRRKTIGILSINKRIIEPPNNHFPVNPKIREEIKKCCKNVFLNSKFFFEEKINFGKKEHLAKLFSVWIDHIIPIAILEGLKYRFKFYKKNGIYIWLKMLG